MNKKNISLVFLLLSVLPLVLSFINSIFFRNASWNIDNLNNISFTLVYLSALASIYVLVLSIKNKEKTLGVLSGIFVLLNVLLIIAGSAVSNFGF